MDISEQYDKLLRYCYMRVRNKNLAEDITQEAFTKFYESTSYHNQNKEMAYLYTIARNLCIDCYKKQRDMILDISENDSVCDKTDTIIAKIEVEQALDKLCVFERELVTLKFISELSDADIGKMLGISRFSVHRRLKSVLKKLKKELEG